MGKRGRAGHIFSKVKKFINFRATRNNTVYEQMRTREWNYFTPPLVNVVWKFFPFFPFIRRRFFRLKFADWLEDKVSSSFASSCCFDIFLFRPTNDILFSIISILELQLTTGKKKMFFNVGRIFLFFYQFFPSRRSSFVSLKKKRKISPPLFYPSSRRGESWPFPYWKKNERGGKEFENQ